MSLSINNNITALNAWRNLKNTDTRMTGSMEKLSSGMRINRASDDPAGLVISEKMRAQLSGLGAAQKNAEKAINLVSTAEGALDKVNELLLKMRSLVVDTANLGVTDQDMATANQNELNEAIDSITRIATNTQFGTKQLLQGDYSTKDLVFQIGANDGQRVSVRIEDMRASALGAGQGTNKGALSATGVTSATAGQADTLTYAMVKASGIHALETQGVLSVVGNADNATSAAQIMDRALKVIDDAIDTVSAQRGKLGAVQADNLQVNLDSLRVSYENLQSAESTIRDTDMTAEMANFTKYQIMMQAGTAMLAQANQMPNNILQLLR